MFARQGQALIEYLIVFSFIALIAVNLVKGLGNFMGGTVGSLAYELTQQLTTGVCKSQCFYDGYINK